MQALMASQTSFTAALLDASMVVPASVRGARTRRAESGLSVYRNNVAVSLINAVGARFPVVRRLLGEDSFLPTAHRYVVSEPPRSPVLLHYGDTFPDYLRSLGPSASLEYLASVAELELARARAYHAADATPVGAEAFSLLSPERFHALRVTLHPSVSLLASRFPIVSIWELEQSESDAVAIPRWGPEAALVARPYLEVEVRRLPPGGLAFLKSLSQGATMASAAEAGMADAEDFDLATSLTVLIGSNIVVGFFENA